MPGRERLVEFERAVVDDRLKDEGVVPVAVKVLPAGGVQFQVVVFQIKCRNFSDLLMKSISSASKLRQWQVWPTEICAAKIRKFSRIPEKSAASANDLKNPRRRIVLVNDVLQIVFSLALPSSSTNASSFDLNNHTRR